MQTDTIHFSAPHDKELTIHTGNLRWEIHSKKLAKRIYTSLLSVGVILLLCLFERGNPSMFKFMTFLGIAASVATFFEFTSYFNRKGNYRKAILALAQRFDQYKEPISYEFSEKSMKYQDAERSLELQWSALKGYSFYKDHLFIWQGNSVLDTFVFSEQEDGFDAIKYDRLLELVKQKMSLKTR